MYQSDTFELSVFCPVFYGHNGEELSMGTNAVEGSGTVNASSPRTNSGKKKKGAKPSQSKSPKQNQSGANLGVDVSVSEYLISRT